MMKKLNNLVQRFNLTSLRLADEQKVNADWDALTRSLSDFFPSEVDYRQRLMTEPNTPTIMTPHLAQQRQVNPAQRTPAAIEAQTVQNLSDLGDNKALHNALEAANLPYHVNDKLWLSKYLFQQMRLNGQFVDFGNVADFVDYSSVFADARNTYEQNLIKDQTQYMLAGGVNALVPAPYRTPKMYVSPDYDKLFRQSVIDSLDNLGIEPATVEKTLEQNADLWRRQVMTVAFNNRYYPIFAADGYTVLPDQPIDPQFKQQHQAVWLRLREYQYYQDHQAVIDELNLATPTMQMSTDEAFNLVKTAANFHTIHRNRTQVKPAATAEYSK